jgi:hypothetical protein
LGSQTRRNQRIFDLRLGCYTQEEIAEGEELTQQAIQTVLQESSDLKKFVKSDLARAEHAVDFEISLYNVWKQQVKTEGSGHFGNPEVRWSSIDQNNRERRDATVFSLWLACSTEQEIAERVGMPRTSESLRGRNGQHATS